MWNLNPNFDGFNYQYSLFNNYTDILIPMVNNQTLFYYPYVLSDPKDYFQPSQTFFYSNIPEQYNAMVLSFNTEQQIPSQLTEYGDSLNKYVDLQNYTLENHEQGKFQHKSHKNISQRMNYHYQGQEEETPLQLLLNKEFYTFQIKKYKKKQNKEINKKQIQNLRYQKKNIQANIVNKIYTFLKSTLKTRSLSKESKFIQRQKAINYLRILNKLQKVRKQSIKRQFLLGLVSNSQSLTGYSKIIKELQKRKQNIKQFEYFIRIIVRNYLKTNGINSILTSKKMNQMLWINHLDKLRELQQYLFQKSQQYGSIIQNSNSSSSQQS